MPGHGRGDVVNISPPGVEGSFAMPEVSALIADQALFPLVGNAPLSPSTPYGIMRARFVLALWADGRSGGHCIEDEPRYAPRKWESTENLELQCPHREFRRVVLARAVPCHACRLTNVCLIALETAAIAWIVY